MSDKLASVKAGIAEGGQVAIVLGALRTETIVRPQAKGRNAGKVTSVCIGYGIGECPLGKLGKALKGHSARVAVTITVDPETAIAMGVKMVADDRAPGAVTVHRGMTLEALLAAAEA